MPAANYLFNAAQKDGTVIGLFHEAQVMNQLTGGEGVQFELLRFNWLGCSYDEGLDVELIPAGSGRDRDKEVAKQPIGDHRAVKSYGWHEGI